MTKEKAIELLLSEGCKVLGSDGNVDYLSLPGGGYEYICINKDFIHGWCYSLALNATTFFELGKFVGRVTR